MLQASWPQKRPEWREAIPSPATCAGRVTPASTILPAITDPVSRIPLMTMLPDLIAFGRHQGETIPLLSMQ
jgi:hypothetical protein